MERFLFASEYCPNYLCTLSNSKKSLNRKLLDEVLGSGIVVLLEELRSLHMLSGAEGIVLHTFACVLTHSRVHAWAHVPTKVTPHSALLCLLGVGQCDCRASVKHTSEKKSLCLMGRAEEFSPGGSLGLPRRFCPWCHCPVLNFVLKKKKKVC